MSQRLDPTDSRIVSRGTWDDAYRHINISQAQMAATLEQEEYT